MPAMGKKGKKSRDSESDTERGSEVDIPLPKLVLKVALEEKAAADQSSVDENKGSDSDSLVNHQKKKKKSKKHKHDKNEEGEKKSRKREATDVVDGEKPVKKIFIKVPKEKQQQPVEEKNVDLSPLQLCLDNLHRTLQRKDVYEIFAYPVTDAIAPGYSAIIKQSVDFTSMSRKIHANTYQNIEQFRDDFVLMCKNAMLYNGPDTIYYKAAEKVLMAGMKLLAQDKIRKLNRSIDVPVSDHEDEDNESDESMEDVEASPPVLPLVETKQKNTSIQKDVKARKRSTAAQPSITKSVLEAARQARLKLQKKCPNSLYGYMSTEEGGETFLNVLNPDIASDDRKRAVNLGSLAGKLTTGVSVAQLDQKEERKNKIIPINYLFNGPYGSFGPTYDSSMSNLTKEESALLLSAYGTELGATYVKSLLAFTQDSSQFLIDHVDRFLDIISDGNHSKCKTVQEKLKQRAAERTKRQEDKSSDSSSTPSTLQVDSADGENILTKSVSSESIQDMDVDSLLSNNKDDKESSYLLEIGQSKSIANDDMTKMCDQKLSDNSQLLQDLHAVQNKRLSTKLGGLHAVTKEEHAIATSLTDNLQELIGKVKPESIIGTTLGISQPSVALLNQDSGGCSTSVGDLVESGEDLEAHEDFSFEEAMDEEAS